MGGVVGIDVGASGGIAHIYDGVVEAHPMPDGFRIADLLEKWKPTRVYIEKAQAMPKQGVSSMFSYGTGFGILQGICIALEIPYVLVTPQTWSKILHKGTSGKDTKARSIEACQRLFPSTELLGSERSRKPHLGIVEAILIAEYGRRDLYLSAMAHKVLHGEQDCD